MTEKHGHHYVGVFFTMEVVTDGESASHEEIANEAFKLISNHVVEPGYEEYTDGPLSFHIKVLQSDYDCDDTDNAVPIDVNLESLIGPIIAATSKEEFMDALKDSISPKPVEQTDAVVYDLFKKKKLGG